MWFELYHNKNVFQWALAMFAAYALIGNILTPAIAFTTLSYIEVAGYNTFSITGGVTSCIEVRITYF